MDPHKARYWRFYYYSLRPHVSLVNAYVDTGEAKYLTRLRQLNNSFLRASRTSPLAWSDEHSVAFRGMVLTYQWWTLREFHALTEDESAALLTEISRTADYLADPNHYQPHMNHGTSQIAALLMIAQSFPDLPRSRQWLDLAEAPARCAAAADHRRRWGTDRELALLPLLRAGQVLADPRVRGGRSTSICHHGWNRRSSG